MGDIGISERSPAAALLLCFLCLVSCLAVDATTVRWDHFLSPFVTLAVFRTTQAVSRSREPPAATRERLQAGPDYHAADSLRLQPGQRLRRLARRPGRHVLLGGGDMSVDPYRAGHDKPLDGSKKRSNFRRYAKWLGDLDSNQGFPSQSRKFYR